MFHVEHKPEQLARCVCAPRIGVLATFSSPYFPHILQALDDYGVGLEHVVGLLDSRDGMGRFWQQRTGGVLDRRLSEFPRVPLHMVESHNATACADLIRRLDLTVLLNAGTPRKLNEGILTATPHGVINVHPGLLPRYRGCTVVEWALYNNDPVGNTAHFMTTAYDEGPIILAEPCDLSACRSYQEARVRTYKEGFMLMATALEIVLRMSLTPATAAPQGEGTYWSAIPDEKMAAVVRWNRCRRCERLLHDDAAFCAECAEHVAV